MLPAPAVDHLRNQNSEFSSLNLTTKNTGSDLVALRVSVVKC